MSTITDGLEELLLRVFMLRVEHFKFVVTDE
jgi:hypothetical protein